MKRNMNWQDITDFPTSLTDRHYVLHRDGIPLGSHVPSEDCPCRPYPAGPPGMWVHQHIETMHVEIVDAHPLAYLRGNR